MTPFNRSHIGPVSVHWGNGVSKFLPHNSTRTCSGWITETILSNVISQRALPHPAHPPLQSSGLTIHVLSPLAVTNALVHRWRWIGEQCGAIHSPRLANIPFQKCHFPSGSVPHLMQDSLDSEECPKRHHDRFSRFCATHPCAQHTDQTAASSTVSTGDAAQTFIMS